MAKVRDTLLQQGVSRYWKGAMMGEAGYGSAEGFRRWAETPSDPVDVAISIAMLKLSHVETVGAEMQRDMELVRKILKLVRDKPHLQLMALPPLPGYDADLFGRHVEMLFNAGYIEGFSDTVGAGKPNRIRIYDLSWSGHEFYGAIAADDAVWEKVKTAFGPEKLATVPLKMIESVAMSAVTAWGLKQMGLS